MGVIEEARPDSVEVSQSEGEPVAEAGELVPLLPALGQDGFRHIQAPGAVPEVLRHEVPEAPNVLREPVISEQVPRSDPRATPSRQAGCWSPSRP